jgi:hypothetical protein
MPVYPGAIWRPVEGHTNGPMDAYLGVALHVNQSNGNLYNWVAGDHDMSCHFEFYKGGDVEQYLDTNESSWCQKNGNNTYLSFESEGYTTEELTPAQVSKMAKVYAWLHEVHDIEFKLADKVGDLGFGWHGMGGYDWGNHLNCPGDLRKTQRSEILNLAQDPAPVLISPEEEEVQAQLLLDDKGQYWIDYGGPAQMIPLNTPERMSAFLAVNGLPKDPRTARRNVLRIEVDRENASRATATQHSTGDLLQAVLKRKQA